MSRHPARRPLPIAPRERGVKAMRCEIVISLAERRKHKALAGKVAVGLVSCRSLGVDVATWYMLSHGVSVDTILRVLTAPARRRR
jgi:hypothetical protein